MDKRNRRKTTNREGERNPAAKLNEKQVAEIRGLLAGPNPPTQVALAEMYGVGQSTIGRIAHGKSWLRKGDGQSTQADNSV